MLEIRLIVKECTRLVEAWLIIQAIVDVVIAVYMCLLLQRRRTGFQKTDSIINRMVLYTISTGLVTCVLSCVYIVLFTKYQSGFGVLVIGMPLGGFYSITMLTNLHMRTRLRGRLSTPSPLQLISYSIKKRTRKNAVDHGSGERFQPTTMNPTTEVICNDADIKPMNSDTKVRFTVIQGSVSGGGGRDLN